MPISLRPVPPEMSARLIVALDVDDVPAAHRLVDALEGVTTFFKIGIGLLYQPNVGRLVADLVGSGRQVFLDTKIYDIGETVRRGVASVARRGARFATVHGDPAILQAAVAGAAGSPLGILAVSVLTSLDDAALQAMGYTMPAQDLVAVRVRAAAAAGCQGVIASAADEPDRLREVADDERLLVITPGIRMPDSPADDQRRVSTPAEAIARGADYLVVGRPVIKAVSSRDAALRIIEDMERGGQRR